MSPDTKKRLKIIAAATGGVVLAAIVGAVVLIDRNVAPSLTYDELSEYAYDTLTLPDGMNVNYREQGNPDGPTLLLVHGGGGSIDDWNPWLPALEPDYHIVSVDLPGHGLTDPLPDSDYGPDRFATFLADFVAATGLEDFAIAGHSFGGDSVVRYVLDNPNTPTAMILVASGGFRPPDDQISETEQDILAYGNTWWGRLVFPYLGTRETVKEGLDTYFHDPSANTDEYTDKIWRLSIYKKNRGTMLELLVNSLSTYTDVANLDTITIPALILWGEQDTVALPQFARRFHHELPNANLTTYPDVGHMLMMEHPDSVNDVLTLLNQTNPHR